MTLNIAHRGACSLAPENTLAAARRALAAGADMWETDIAVTRDETLVLFHDDTLSRTTDAETVFPERRPWMHCDFTKAELGRLSAGAGYLKTDPFGQIAAGQVTAEAQRAMASEKIPTLEQALVLTREANWRINLELKRLPAPMTTFPVAERVLDLIEHLAISAEHVILSSFNHDWLRQARSRRPDIAVQALIGYHTDRPLDWGDLSFDTYNTRWPLVTPAKIKERVARNIAVNVWVVNDPDEMRSLIDAGAAGIMTDFPQRLASVLASG